MTEVQPLRNESLQACEAAAICLLGLGEMQIWEVPEFVCVIHSGAGMRETETVSVSVKTTTKNQKKNLVFFPSSHNVHIKPASDT